MTYFRRFALLVLLNCLVAISISSAVQQWETPILDIDDEAKGYLGTINERNVLVDLKPHLQIKNIDAINGICSYHVFKPNTEEFPFTIDIKDKSTGEAVIELIKKEQEPAKDGENSPSNNKPLLDCNKRKEYHFLLQAHDCSNPSMASNKVPVKIEVLDHDDSELKFESANAYTAKLVKTDETYDNFLLVKARDSDCTNEGYACMYQLASNSPDVDVASLPFKIDNNGWLSSTRSLNKAEMFSFNVRAFDCVSKDSFVETQVTVEIVEPCVPQWTDVPGEVQSASANTNVFSNLRTTSCESKSDSLKNDAICQIDSVNAKVVLELDPSIINACETEKCGENALFNNKDKADPKSESKVVLFTTEPKSNPIEDDDSLEDDESNESNSFEDNKVVPVKDLKSQQPQAPLSYRTFSKVIENAEKINFDGKFASEFVLSAWIRRPANADKSTKEQVFCGTDSELMNRHHYGLYFYKGNVKFLMRHEPNENAPADNTAKSAPPATGSNEDDFNTNQKFWPSLWEWSLSPKLLTDNQWHFYEVKFSYPNASLFIDGVKFVENVTNSDIIDAYELNSVSGVGAINTYVGACYHARTHSLIDHFEGDISEIVLTTKKASSQALSPVKTEEQKSLIKCSKNCREYIEMNLIGNENYIQSIQNSNQNEISIQTSNLNDMVQIIQKVSYNNKDFTQYPTGARNVKIVSSIHCSNTGKSFNLNEVNVKLNVDDQKQEYNVQIDGDKELSITKDDLTYGLEVFKHITILKNPINKIDSGKDVDIKSITDEDSNESDDDASSSSAEANKPATDDSAPIKFSQCTIKITPERNLMAPTQNNEKLMFLQSLMDQYEFSFEETSDMVTISGVQNVENYETFIKSLTYRISNLNENEEPILINNKQFQLTCMRSDPNIQTNSVTVKLLLTSKPKSDGFIANKQMQRLVIGDDDEEILTKKTNDDSFSAKSGLGPLAVAFIVLCCCCTGFLIVFGVIRLHTSGYFVGRRKMLPNEENPQMEWDDSGLNITENPLDDLENKKRGGDYQDNPQCQLDYEDEYSSGSETEEDGECHEFEEEEEYSSEEETEKRVGRELEWDDSTLELKIKDQKLKMEQQKQLHQQFQMLTSSESSNKIL